MLFYFAGVGEVDFFELTRVSYGLIRLKLKLKFLSTLMPQ